MNADRWYALKPYNRDMISMLIGGMFGAVTAILAACLSHLLWPSPTVGAVEILVWVFVGATFTSGGMAFALAVSHWFEDRRH